MIPDYQTLMFPLLKLTSDGQEHQIGDVMEPLAKQLGVDDAELAELLPSGRQPVFYNRVHWAKTYLSQAKLLEITKRAHFRITERGREVLSNNPPRVDVHLLEHFAEFTEFKNRARQSQTGALRRLILTVAADDPPVALATPDELLRTDQISYGKCVGE